MSLDFLNALASREIRRLRAQVSLHEKDRDQLLMLMARLVAEWPHGHESGTYDEAKRFLEEEGYLRSDLDLTKRL